VVRDKQGHAVGSFQKQDFQLTDHGKPQEIAQFAIEGSAVPKPAQPAKPAAAASKMVVPTRFVAFVFDDIHLNTGDSRMPAWPAETHRTGIARRNAWLCSHSCSVSLEFTNDATKFREMLMKIAPVRLACTSLPPASTWQTVYESPGDESLGCQGYQAAAR